MLDDNQKYPDKIFQWSPWDTKVLKPGDNPNNYVRSLKKIKDITINVHDTSVEEWKEDVIEFFERYLEERNKMPIYRYAGEASIEIKDLITFIKQT